MCLFAALLWPTSSSEQGLNFVTNYGPIDATNYGPIYAFKEFHFVPCTNFVFVMLISMQSKRDFKYQ